MNPTLSKLFTFVTPLPALQMPFTSAQFFPWHFLSSNVFYMWWRQWYVLNEYISRLYALDLWHFGGRYNILFNEMYVEVIGITSRPRWLTAGIPSSCFAFFILWMNTNDDEIPLEGRSLTF